MCKGKWRCSIQGQNRISHVCIGGHKGQYCIRRKYGEPIHVEGRSTALNGCEMYYEIFEGHFGLQIMLRRQGCCLERIL